MQALVVNLSSDHASGDKVTFYRQTELDLLSATSKARLKDVVSPVEDDVVSLEGAHKETLFLDKLVYFPNCKPIFYLNCIGSLSDHYSVMFFSCCLVRGCCCGY